MVMLMSFGKWRKMGSAENGVRVDFSYHTTRRIENFDYKKRLRPHLTRPHLTTPFKSGLLGVIIILMGFNGADVDKTETNVSL